MTEVLQEVKPACDWRWLTAGAAAFFVLGLLAGHRIWAPVMVAETSAPEQTMRNGDTAAKRDPAAPVKPAAQVPKGTKPVRVMQAQVLPDDPNCKAVTITATTVREDSGAERVVLHTDGGKLIASVDRPLVDAIAGPVPHPSAVGGTYEPVNRLYGAFIERDIWRIRLGIDAQQTRTGHIEARARIGWTF